MPKKEAVPAVPMRILKIGESSSLSGRSQLTYHIGCNAEGDIHVKVVANSGRGQFNADAIPLATIEKLLTAHPADKPMTSRVMQPVFRSKSANSPAFLFACLLAEGLVKAGAEKDSGYLLGEFDSLKQGMAALIAAGTDLTVAADTPSEAPKTKRPAKATTK
jgi:hypothetical protein